MGWRNLYSHRMEVFRKPSVRPEAAVSSSGKHTRGFCQLLICFGMPCAGYRGREDRFKAWVKVYGKVPYIDYITRSHKNKKNVHSLKQQSTCARMHTHTQRLTVSCLCEKLTGKVSGCCLSLGRISTHTHTHTHTYITVCCVHDASYLGQHNKQETVWKL